MNTVAVNKPSGWLVHRSWLDRHETRFMMQTVRDQLGQHVFTVHRLDRPTGVLLMALWRGGAPAVAAVRAASGAENLPCGGARLRAGGGDLDYPLTAELDKIADKHADADKGPQPAVTGRWHR